MSRLVDEVLDAYRDAPADRPRELAAFVTTTAAWRYAWGETAAPNAPVTLVRSPVTLVQSPVTLVRSPVTVVQSPVTVVQSPVTVVQSPVTVMRSPVTLMQSPVTVMQPPVTLVQPPRIVALAPRPTSVVRRPWPVTPLPDLAALARLLDIDQGELAWFADVRGWERTCAPPLRHYTWTSFARPGGTVRLLAAPKPRLKEIQRRLLRQSCARSRSTTPPTAG